MSWILLIIAGLCEAGFAFCLGKGNLSTGGKAVAWYVAFAVICTLSMYLLTKATKFRKIYVLATANRQQVGNVGLPDFYNV